MKRSMIRLLIVTMISVAVGVTFRLLHGSTYNCVCGSPLKLLLGGSLWFTDWNLNGTIFGSLMFLITIAIPILPAITIIGNSKSMLTKIFTGLLALAAWIGSGYVAWLLVCAG